MTVELRSLRVSAEMDAGKYAAGAAQKVAADKAMSASSKEAAASIASVDTKISQSGDILARLSRRFVEGHAASLDFNSALNGLSKGIDTGKIKMAEAVPILDGIYKKYGLIGDAARFAAKGQTDLAAAIGVANAKLASQRQVVPANQNRLSSGQLQGLGYQANDVITMALLGAPASQIAFSQGGQILQNLQSGEGGIAGSLNAIKGSAVGAASALASTLGPLGLIAAGFTVAGVAAITFYDHVKGGAEKTEDLLKRHGDLLKQIKEGWASAASGVGDYTKESQRVLQFQDRLAQDALSRNMAGDVTDALGGLFMLNQRGASQLQYQYQGLAEPIRTIMEEARTGVPDVIKFSEALVSIAQSPDAPDALKRIANNLLQVTAAAREAQRALNALSNDMGTSQNGLPGFLLSQGQTNALDAKRLQQFQIDDDARRAERVRGFDATLQGMLAKSPLEKQAAAEAAERAKIVASESARDRADRIEIAGKLALAEATKSLVLAQKDRARSLDATMAQQQLDISLIGKTAGEQAALRMEFERTQAVREEAARNGIEADQKELDLIKQKSAEYGRYVDQIARANLNRDLAFEREQMFRSSREQGIASRLRGTGIGLDSDEARQMRDNQRFADARDIAKGFFSDFRSAAEQNGGDIGKAFADAALNAANRVLDKLFDDLFDQLANSIASAVTGVKPGGANLFAGAVGSIGAANDNPAAQSILLGAGGRPTSLGGGSVAQQAWNFFKSKGLPDHQVAALLGQIKAESNFNPNAIGDNGNAFGLFQNQPARGGGRALLASGASGQLEHAWAELNGPESAAFARLRNAPDLRSATRAAIGFERPRGWTLDNPEAGHNFSGRLAGAEAALAKFSGTTDKATQGIDNITTSVTKAVTGAAGDLGNLFGLGLSNTGAGFIDGRGGGLLGMLGTSRAGVLGGAGIQQGGGGGILGWLMSLFGLPGFAEGGHTGAFGGIVHPYEMVFSQSDIRRNGGVAAVDAMRRGAANNNAPAVNFSSTVINNSSAKVEQHEEDDGAGGRHIVYTISDEVTSAMNKPGTSLNRAMRERGATPARKRR